MPLLKGVILIILSILIFRNPRAAVLALSSFIGIAFLITGLIAALTAISFRHQVRGWGWRLAEGLLDIFIGFILLFNPNLTSLVVTFMVGFWFMFYGITSLSDSFGRKDEGQSNWWVRAGWGILSILFGFWVIFRPFGDTFATITLLGTFFFLAGLFNIGFSFVIRKLNQEIDD